MHDLVPFPQIKKREKHPRSSDTFSTVACWSFATSITPPWVFFTFSKKRHILSVASYSFILNIYCLCNLFQSQFSQNYSRVNFRHLEVVSIFPKAFYHPVHSALKLNFGIGVLMQICCMFSEHLFLRAPLEGWFCTLFVNFEAWCCGNNFRPLLNCKQNFQTVEKSYKFINLFTILIFIAVTYFQEQVSNCQTILCLFQKRKKET